MLSRSALNNGNNTLRAGILAEIDQGPAEAEVREITLSRDMER